MTSPLLIGPTPNLVQNIKYTGSETEFSTEIKGDKVIIHCNEGIHNHGSSKVKLIDRIDYNWEFRYYHGHLIAAHIGGKVIAFGMKGKDGGMVRITNQETNNRCLIKNLKEDIKDLAFAFTSKEIILGCVDSEGNILVYQINDTPHSISFTLLLHIYHHDSSRPKTNYRLIWCPYLSIDDEDTDEEPEKMFVILNGSKAEVYNVQMLTSKYDKGPLDPNENYEGYTEIKHTAEVVDASFSSDGTAIAIASVDGYVKFYQLYMSDNKNQNCLHEWMPHDGAPLSSIIFIDNVLEYSAECWKFTITAAKNNSEIKLWSCESWTCLQTIIFKATASSLVTGLYLHMNMDYTGQFLLVSDINNRVIYVLELQRNDKEQIVHVTSLSEFLLPAPFLSLHILEAGRNLMTTYFDNSREDLYDDREDNYEEEQEQVQIVLKMLVIQPKKFQECNIVFQPEALAYTTMPSYPALNGNELPDEELKQDNDKFPKLDDLQESVTLLIQQKSSANLTLMTPDDFTSPTQSDKPVKEENLIDFQRPQKENNFASGGSSPSREVQEILTNYANQDFFDNLDNLRQNEGAEESQKASRPYSANFQETSWPVAPVVQEKDLLKDEALRKELGLDKTQKNQLDVLCYRMSALEEKISRDRGDFLKELELLMEKQRLHMVKFMETVVLEKVEKEQMLSQMLNKSLTDKVQQVVAQEVKLVILPAIRNQMEGYKGQMEAQYTQKMADTDNMLKENITKAFNSKTLADNLSLSVVNIVAPSLEKCYRDIITSSLIPSWERVCGQMFQQINETFTRGTKEYTASVESYMDKQRRVQEKGKDLILQMQTVSESMKSNAENLTGALTAEIHKQFNNVFKSMNDKLSHSVRDIVAEQIKQGFKSHASVLEDSVKNAVRSRAVTPSPNIDSHIVSLSQIQLSLSKHSYHEAFQLALSAENLNYVIYVCERVDTQTLFSEECALPQSCLLSLIQQLSMELNKNTDLKLSYIRAAFLSLSMDCPTTKQFIPKLLSELMKQLNNFIKSNPPFRHVKEAKLLKMAVESTLS
ncbi:unnamed protein product [Phyllotreta striolata]|uniref:Enhancer of mRNA-decapping protein 4 n=1 Tax=Phyllotreta striolata TaxID=444603 RepID=A0A9N9TQK3_PHYSR|nr:unnamed protein product [Phyllotreta striolata]